MAGYTVQLFIGPFPCWVEQAPLEKFSRARNWRWEAQARLTRPNAMQFVGAGDDTITLNGVIHPHEDKCGGKATSMEDLSQIANGGEPQLILTGWGKVLGKYVITDVQEDYENMLDDLRPRKVGFSITLKRYGNDQ